MESSWAYPSGGFLAYDMLVDPEIAALLLEINRVKPSNPISRNAYAAATDVERSGWAQASKLEVIQRRKGFQNGSQYKAHND